MYYFQVKNGCWFFLTVSKEAGVRGFKSNCLFKRCSLWDTKASKVRRGRSQDKAAASMFLSNENRKRQLRSHRNAVVRGRSKSPFMNGERTLVNSGLPAISRACLGLRMIWITGCNIFQTFRLQLLCQQFYAFLSLTPTVPQYKQPDFLLHCVFYPFSQN